MFRTNDLQDIIYTSMVDDIKVTIKKLYLNCTEIETIC